MFYHIIFEDREICWKYGSRVNYNLDLRVVDGALKDRTACLFLDDALFYVVDLPVLWLAREQPRPAGRVNLTHVFRFAAISRQAWPRSQLT